MSRKRPKPEEIAAKLRQADVLIGQGTSGGGNPGDRRERSYLLPLAP